MRGQFSHPYKTTNTVMVLSILIFTFLESRREVEIPNRMLAGIPWIYSAIKFLVNAILICFRRVVTFLKGFINYTALSCNLVARHEHVLSFLRVSFYISFPISFVYRASVFVFVTYSSDAMGSCELLEWALGGEPTTSEHAALMFHVGLTPFTERSLISSVTSPVSNEKFRHQFCLKWISSITTCLKWISSVTSLSQMNKFRHQFCLKRKSSVASPASNEKVPLPVPSQMKKIVWHARHMQNWEGKGKCEADIIIFSPGRLHRMGLQQWERGIKVSVRETGWTHGLDVIGCHGQLLWTW
jgi:hypothetical protein